MILDYDVHHGNGTNDIFYADRSVFFISIHQSPFYPGTGALEEIGAGAGRGYTLNIPLAGGHGDASYRRLFDEVVVPAVERFDPDLMLISAGFDAHWVDPLGGHATFALVAMTIWRGNASAWQSEALRWRIVFVMEGGYDFLALAHGWAEYRAGAVGA